jgi:predicted pyridoxine 5'-phosphate oxidase superfamily flavin-nucleotide-binding protein
MDVNTGFHEGELAVQERADVRAEAQRLSGMLAPGDLRGGARLFLAAQTFAVITARDRRGRLWASPLVGPAGFLAGGGATLDVATAPASGDPLAGLPAGQAVGMIAIDFATRRRLRVNGTLLAVGGSGLRVDVAQVYGNCPQYIRPRSLEAVPRVLARNQGAPRASSFASAHTRLIESADTFFLGTAHPSRGADTSHRGGPPGFVRVVERGLWWPDYPGNNMFNSLGNLAVDDAAALLFLDFATGATLHLSGAASVEWAEPGVQLDGDDRRVHFELESLTLGAGLGVRDTELTQDRPTGGGS